MKGGHSRADTSDECVVFPVFSKFTGFLAKDKSETLSSMFRRFSKQRGKDRNYFSKRQHSNGVLFACKVRENIRQMQGVQLSYCSNSCTFSRLGIVRTDSFVFLNFGDGWRRFYLEPQIQVCQGCLDQHSGSGRNLRSARASGCDERAFAGRSCGPLRSHSEPQIQHSRFKIRRSAGARSGLLPVRDAACGLPMPDSIDSRPSQARSRADGLATAALRPGAAAGCCGFLRSRKFSIQNSRFKIINRDEACGGRSDTEELRASAAGGCGPPIAARLILTTYFPAKPAAERTSLRRPSDAIQNPEFKIQNYEIQAAACGEPLEADLRVASLRCRETAARSAFTRPEFKIIKSECSLGLLGPGGPIQTRNTLPAELRTFAVPCGSANEF